MQRSWSVWMAGHAWAVLVGYLWLICVLLNSPFGVLGPLVFWSVIFAGFAYFLVSQSLNEYTQPAQIAGLCAAGIVVTTIAVLAAIYWTELLEAGHNLHLLRAGIGQMLWLGGDFGLQMAVMLPLTALVVRYEVRMYRRRKAMEQAPPFPGRH